MKEVRPPSEIQIQAQCFQLLWNLYPETRKLFFAVPNGGYRSDVEAKHLQASGVVAGVADTILFWQEKAYAIEFKDAKGTQREEQHEFEQACLRQSIPYHVVRTLEEFLYVVLPIIIPELTPDEVSNKVHQIYDDQQKRIDAKRSRSRRGGLKTAAC